ncbi:tRNA (5-methylaminomethyl-2-thiouridine)(34)-methyltransferase MnmD [Myxosarcina sp. GI1]|uniref:tRNA (5-methylaminomethyl-2-thiouridine)(34)-methyltransferase MnmD n=1 Tax=Myxosarcina sp. GI1 TaxID=1541065 RepID=UPI000566991F|nr:MnmC family methyltransferase [Myxosarcina sp. GI1]
MNEQFVPQFTNDGSQTFFSKKFNEAFHSYHGAKQEAETKYVEPTLIKAKARQSTKIYLLDVCYGLGYNSAAAIEAIWSVNPRCHIELFGLELEPSVPRQASLKRLLSSWRQPIPQLLDGLAFNSQITERYLKAKLLFGDARQTIQQIFRLGWQADAIFLDPFSPPKCPQLWTVEFIAIVAKCLKPSGRLATYSCAAAVRSALSLAGLQFGSIYLANRSPGTIASLAAANLPPLTLQEREHLVTRAAVPYRDRWLNASAAEIEVRRQQEQNNSQLEPSSKWKKRWLMSRERLPN